MRRDLERRLFDLQHSNELADRGSEKKLRKELKKLKMLYRDAKYALDNQVCIELLFCYHKECSLVSIKPRFFLNSSTNLTFT